MTECINCKGVIKLDYVPSIGYAYHHLFVPGQGSAWCWGIGSSHARASDKDFERDKELLDAK